MAPHIRNRVLSSNSSLWLTAQQSVCPKCLFQLQRRHLSATPPQYIVRNRQREKMFRWLNGPGKAFASPLPGSTNYLNAYDIAGNLIRARDMPTTDRQHDVPTENDPSSETSRDGNKVDEGSEKIPGKQRSPKLLKEQAAARTREVSLPKESPDDLIPFPMNRSFRSQSVLSEEFKDEIYRRIMEEGMSVRDVSAALGVEMRRVGAVVRLKAVEKRMEAEGQRMAIPFGKAVMAMLPQTPYVPNQPVAHESINDLPVHYATTKQIFYPVSESRHFTRRDAATVFDEGLLPAEDRIPHPELYEMEKWKAQGMVLGERVARRREANEQEAKRKEQLQKRREEKERLTTKKAMSQRWEFRFQDISAENVGANGRDRKGIGARYGMPAEDRKKGQIKIPRRVDV